MPRLRYAATYQAAPGLPEFDVRGLYRTVEILGKNKEPIVTASDEVPGRVRAGGHGHGLRLDVARLPWKQIKKK